MQVAAMVRGGAGAMKVGESGLWAMIERKVMGVKKPLPGREAVFVYCATIRTTSRAVLLLSTVRSSRSVRSSHHRGPCTG
ncbi:hypothetical protein C1X89_27495 [Pseudomonas sp. GP01-A8]|nr:hypothetical protein C0058_06825 [Pseudomonas sp. NC02]PMU33577.1 hypothetical protein C1X89_27495 [Pseudomonas sp. GP01-A8]QBQ09475.1 hypothetical protein DCC84_06835 [Pseudomonas sp. SXM-1]